MSHHVLVPLGLLLVAGVFAPWALVRARWALHAPRLAAAVWAACGALFVLSAALLPALLVLPAADGDRLTALLLAGCLPAPGRLAAPTVREATAAGAALAVLALPAAGFVREVVRARRARARHAAVLRLVGRYDPALRATVLEHDRPAVYCLPGRARRIVVSSAAVRALTSPQLTAALAHERAHLAGRHHLAVAAARAFAAVFPGLPLARHGGGAVPLLLELAADDRALRHSSRDALATALYALAAGHAPRDAFAAGGPTAALRMRRILTPYEPGHPALRGLLAVGSAVGALTPLVVACCSLPA